MQKKKMLITEVAVVLASSINYTSVTLLNSIWRLELYVLIPMLFIVTFLMGLITIDTKKALVYAISGIFFGTALATAVMVAPAILLGEGGSIVDSALNTALNAVSKFLIFSVVVSIISALMGSVVGELVEPITDFQA